MRRRRAHQRTWTRGVRNFAREAFTEDIEDWCSNATVLVREFLDSVYLVKSLLREVGDGHEGARCNGGGYDGTTVRGTGN